jgi:hypothetical protein
MMSRRRFMARTSAAIDELVNQLALTDPEQAGVRTRMARYNRDCGCAMGTIGAAIGLVIACALLGKVTGLIVASARLGLLRLSLSGHARRMRSESHVYVH